MTPEQFVYWLQGFAELGNAVPTARQWAVIQDHLAQVFGKKTPVRDGQMQLPLIFDPERKPAKPEFVC